MWHVEPILGRTSAAASSSRARRCPRGPAPAKEFANSDTPLTFPEDDEHDEAAVEDEAKACVQDKVSRYSVAILVGWMADRTGDMSSFIEIL